MATNAREELLNALRDIECFSGNFKSAYALMYAYLTGTEQCRDRELAEAFEQAYQAITHRERLQKRGGWQPSGVHARRFHARGRKAEARKHRLAALGAST